MSHQPFKFGTFSGLVRWLLDAFTQQEKLTLLKQCFYMNIFACKMWPVFYYVACLPKRPLNSVWYPFKASVLLCRPACGCLCLPFLYKSLMSFVLPEGGGGCGPFLCCIREGEIDRE